MYFGKRIVYTDTHTHVIIREIGHTLAARIMKYNTTTTYNIFRSKDRHSMMKKYSLGGYVVDESDGYPGVETHGSQLVGNK